MNCSNCKFTVGPDMKFALMKNICPSCGTNLFSQEEMNDISRLQSRVSAQEFADELDEIEIYDVAFFVFNEMKTGIGQIFIQREIERINSGTIEEEGAVEDPEDISEDDIDEAENDDSSEEERIREEVRNEVLGPEELGKLQEKQKNKKGKKKRPRIRAPIPEDDFEDSDDEFVLKPRSEESVEDKVNRLKRVARGNTNKTGPMVKRVG